MSCARQGTPEFLTATFYQYILLNWTEIRFEIFFSLFFCKMFIKQLIDLRKVRTVALKFRRDL